MQQLALEDGTALPNVELLCFYVDTLEIYGMGAVRTYKICVLVGSGAS